MISLLLIGGRSGVGKTSVAFEVSARWRGAGVAHCLVDGDHLGFAYPKPADDPHGTLLTGTNLRAVWANYRAAGYDRLVYVNTVSVLPDEIAWIRAAVEPTAVTAVLLTGSDRSVRERLSMREQGSELDVHLERSRRADGILTREARAAHVPTDGRTVSEVAGDVLALVEGR